MGSAEGERRKEEVSNGQTAHFMILNDCSEKCGNYLWKLRSDWRRRSNSFIDICKRLFVEDSTVEDSPPFAVQIKSGGGGLSSTTVEMTPNR